MDSIIVKYSQSPGVEPVPNQLLTGEPVMNTYDGRLFMKKSNVDGDFIVSFVNFYDLPTATVLSASFSSTASFVTPLRQNVIITGSLNISGSTVQVGDNTLLGNTLLSGSITISGSFPVGSYSASVNILGDTAMSGYLRFNSHSTNIDNTISASYIYVSGSTNDLYFSQNGGGFTNTTRLRWLEGNLYTGLLNGGLISITTGSTTFNISSGSGIIVTLNASINDNPYPTIKYVNWGNKIAQPLTYISSSIQTFIGIDSDGNVIQQTSPWNDGQYNTSISIGTVLHQNKSTVNASITYPNVAYGYKQRTYDFIKAFGPLKLSGFTLIPSGSLGLGIGSGTAFSEGRNYQVDPNNPSYITDPGTSVSKIFRYYQSGSEFVQDTNNAVGYTEIDPANYNLNGTLTPVPGTGANREWSIKRVFWYPNSATKGIVVYYGNTTYPSSTDAIAGLPYESFTETPNTQQNAIYVGAIAIRNDGNFLDSGSFAILPGGVFRNVGGSGGGGSLPTVRLSDLSDVDILGTADHQPLAYNSTTLKWTNQSNISASISGNAETATTASYARTASYVENAISSSYSSLSQNANTASYVTTAQTASYVTTAQSASYVTTAQTASYVTTAQTASYVLTARTASFVDTAQTASYVLQSVSSSFSILADTASFIATASNAISSSYSVTASYVLGQTATSSYAISASQAVTASYLLGGSVTSSYAISSSNAVSSSYAVTASYVLGQTATSSFAISASNSNSASLATTASYALTAPYTGLLGTVPTWNQNTTGTAANITATSNTTLTSIANLAVVGTITNGIWNANPIADTYISSATNWNTAYGWGNHASAGYLTSYTETDTLASVTGRGNSTTSSITVAGLTVNTNPFNLNTYIKGATAGFIVNDNADTANNFGVTDSGNVRVYRGSLTIGSVVGTGTGTLYAGSIIKSGGTSAQFLKADGSVDSTAYYAASNPSGYTTNTGTVTSVSGTGTVSGLTLTGTVTSSGSLTLGGTLSLTSGQVTTALGYTPYNSSNPNGYTTNTGTVTSVAGTGTVSGLTLTGTVTTSGTLTLGGTLSLTSGQVTTALGYTPYNSSNPSGYISSYTETDTLGSVTNRGNSTSQNIVFSNGRKGLIGVYDAAQTQAIFAMGAAYTLTDGGASNNIGNLYGLAWSYNPDYGGTGNNPQSKAGLNHQLLLMQAGITTAALGSGIWTSGNITAANFSGTSSGTNTGDQTNISGNAATATTSTYVTVNSGNTSADWYPILWHSGNGIYSSSGVQIYAAGNYIRSQYINTTDNLETGITRFLIKNGDDYHRSATTTTAADIIRGVASGTWGISISGNAGSVAWSGITSKPTTLSGYGITDSLYQAVATIDVNAFNATGLYRGSTSGWSNRPTVVHNGGALLQIDTHPGNYSSQLFFDTGGNRLYLRSADAGTWGSWATIYHTGNLTNLNQLTNGPGYTTNTGTVTSVSGTGTVSGLTLSGTVTTSGNLTLGGTLSLTSGNVTSALGYTPLSSSGNVTIGGYLTVTGAGTSSSIYMSDSDEGQREIHCNSNRIGFLTQAGSWGAWCDDSGNWSAANFSGSSSGTNTGDQTNISGNAATATTATTTTGNAGSVTYLPNRTDGTAYPVLWGAAYTNSIGTIAYSCAAVTITSSTGLLTCSSLTETSSKRYKENIVPLENSLDKVVNLRGVKYNKIGNEFQEIGVIAEEVEEVVPEVVVYNEEGQADSVSYGRMTALLIEAIKEQQVQIQHLKAEIEVLKQK